MVGRHVGDHVGGQLAGYKAPKRLVVVDKVERSPSGKADYRWAAAVASAGDVGGRQAGEPAVGASGEGQPTP